MEFRALLPAPHIFENYIEGMKRVLEENVFEICHCLPYYLLLGEGTLYQYHDFIVYIHCI